jgi:hypothetical protein
VKRSEMLDALAWYLEEKYDLGYRASEQILSFLERQGMQPPAYSVQEKNGPYVIQEYTVHNKWEDEE